MPLNWLSNLEFTKEDPVKWNTKDLLTQQNEIRDLKRKRAIERSIAGSVDKDGNFSEASMRQRLIEEGFGENADEIVNKFTTERTKKAIESLDTKEKATNLFSQGIINKAEYDRLVGAEEKLVDEEPKAVTQKATSETDWQDPSKDSEEMKATPEWQKLYGGTSQSTTQAPQADGSKIGEVVVPGKVKTPKEQEQEWGPLGKFRNPKVVQSPPQFTPKYATFSSDVDIDKYMGKSGKESTPRVFEVSSDKNTARNQIAAAQTHLGFAIDPKKDASEQISKKITEIAKQNTIEPKRRSYKESTDYFKAVSEWEAKVRENEQKLIEGIQAQQNALFGQGIQAKDVEIREAQVFHPDFGVAMGETTKEKLSTTIGAIKGIDSILDQLKTGNYKPNSPGFEGLKLALAKEMIVAFNLPVGEGVLQAVEDKIKNGQDWWGLFPTSPKEFVENAKKLRKDMTLADAIKLGQESQANARNRYLAYKPKDMKKFNETFHIYGVSGAVSDLKGKKGPAKPQAPRKTFSELQAERGKK